MDEGHHDGPLESLSDIDTSSSPQTNDTPKTRRRKSSKRDTEKHSSLHRSISSSSSSSSKKKKRSSHKHKRTDSALKGMDSVAIDKLLEEVNNDESLSTLEQLDSLHDTISALQLHELLATEDDEQDESPPTPNDTDKVDLSTSPTSPNDRTANTSSVSTVNNDQDTSAVKTTTAKEEEQETATTTTTPTVQNERRMSRFGIVPPARVRSPSVTEITESSPTLKKRGSIDPQQVRTRTLPPVPKRTLSPKKPTTVSTEASELRKQLLRENALSNSALYRARRFSIAQPSAGVSAVQVEVHELKERRKTHSDQAESGEQLFANQGQRLHIMLQSAMKDQWRLDLFRRFLQQSNRESVLNFYLEIQTCKQLVRDLEATRLVGHESDTQQQGYYAKLEELREFEKGLLIKYVHNHSFPKHLKHTLKSTVLPLLLSLLNDENVPQTPTSNLLARRKSSTAELELLHQESSVAEGGGDPDPDAGGEGALLSPHHNGEQSEVEDENNNNNSGDEYNSDEYDDVFEPQESLLEEDDMKLLDTTDANLLNQPSRILRQTLSRENLHHFVDVAADRRKTLDKYLFHIAERRTYNLLLNDLFPEFICSHNQVTNLSSAYSTSGHHHSALEGDSSDASSTTAATAGTSPTATDDGGGEEGKRATSSSATSTGTASNDQASDESKKDIVYGDNNAIDACTFDRCVKQLITTGNISNDFHYSVVMTFQYFTNAIDLIEGMRNHLQGLLAEEEKEHEADREEYRKKNILPVVIRITSALRSLFDLHLEHFRAHNNEYKFLLEFITKDIRALMETAGTNLKDLIIKKMVQKEAPVQLQFDKKPPKPKLSRSFSTLKDVSVDFHQIHVVEFARQLAILDHRLYKAVRPEECLHMRWTKDDKDLKAPNVLASIRQFCSVGLYVVNEIVKEVDLERRVTTLTKMITIAYESLKLKNFNGAMAVISGLLNHCVFRLKDTWEAMADKAWDMWEELRDIFKPDQNFAALRLVNAECTLPAVPYLGMYLSDLTFIDNESNFIDSEKTMINFVKMQYIGSITRQIQKYQQGAYCLQPVEPLQKYLSSLPTFTETELYEKSAKCESKKNGRASAILPELKKDNKRGFFKKVPSVLNLSDSPKTDKKKK